MGYFGAAHGWGEMGGGGSKSRFKKYSDIKVILSEELEKKKTAWETQHWNKGHTLAFGQEHSDIY